MNLKEFLLNKAREIRPEIFDETWPDVLRYSENINPDAINGEAWLKNKTSYIWKVGVLATWDSNKFDYSTVFIGHEREPGRSEFIGYLHWADGENDDIGRCLVRYLNLLQSEHPVFENT